MTDILKRLPAMTVCGICGQPAYWSSNGIALCLDAMRNMAVMNGDNEEYFAPALKEQVDRPKKRASKRAKERAEANSERVENAERIQLRIHPNLTSGRKMDTAVSRPWNIETTPEQDQAERESWTSQADEDRSYLTARDVAAVLLRRPNYDVLDVVVEIRSILYLPEHGIWLVVFDAIISEHYRRTLEGVFRSRQTATIERRNGSYTHAGEHLMRLPGEEK